MCDGLLMFSKSQTTIIYRPAMCLKPSHAIVGMDHVYTCEAFWMALKDGCKFKVH